MATELEIKLNEIQEEKNSKIIPENIKKDVQIFDVVGTYEGSGASAIEGAKIFTSVEEMMSTTDQSDNTYGIVYYDNTKPTEKDKTYNYIFMPETVVLDTPVTSTLQGYFMAEGDSFGTVDISLSAAAAQIRCQGVVTDNAVISATIYYASDDGITYTINSPEYANKIITFYAPTTFTPYSSTYYTWDDRFGEFMRTGSMWFDGPFEWKEDLDNEYMNAVVAYNINTSSKSISSVNEPVYVPLLKDMVKKIHDEFQHRDMHVVKENGKYVVYATSGWLGVISGTKNNMQLIPSISYSGVTSDFTSKRYILDFERFTFSEEPIVGNITVQLLNSASATTGTSYMGYKTTCEEYIGYFINGFFRTDGGVRYINSSNKGPYGYTNNATTVPVAIRTWHRVQTEFDLKHSGQLLPNLTALGKHGPITGNEAIYDSIELQKILYSGIDTQLYKSGFCIMSTDNASGKSLKTVNGNAVENNISGTKYLREVKGLFEINNNIEILYMAYSENYIACVDKNCIIHFYNLIGEEIHTVPLTITLDKSEYIWFDIYDTNGIITFFITNRTYNGSSNPSEAWPLTYGYFNTNDASHKEFTLSVWSDFLTDAYGLHHAWYHNGDVYLGMLGFGTSTSDYVSNLYKNGVLHQKLSDSSFRATYNWYDGKKYLYVWTATVTTIKRYDLDAGTYTVYPSAITDMLTNNYHQHIVHDKDNNLYVWAYAGVGATDPAKRQVRLYRMLPNDTLELIYDPAEDFLETSTYHVPNYIRFIDDNSALLFSAVWNRIGFISPAKYELCKASAELEVVDKYGLLDSNTMITSYGSDILKTYSSMNNAVTMYILRPDLKVTDENTKYTLCKLNHAPTTEQIYITVTNELFEPDYTNTITPEEYDTAIDTATEILGEEV